MNSDRTPRTRRKFLAIFDSRSYTYFQLHARHLGCTHVAESQSYIKHQCSNFTAYCSIPSKDLKATSFGFVFASILSRVHKQIVALLHSLTKGLFIPWVMKGEMHRSRTSPTQVVSKLYECFLSKSLSTSSMRTFLMPSKPPLFCTHMCLLGRYSSPIN